MGRNFVNSCLIFSIFLFSSQNQVPLIIIGLGRVKYLIRDFSFVIRATLNIFQKKLQCREKTSLETLIFRLISGE